MLFLYEAWFWQSSDDLKLVAASQINGRCKHSHYSGICYCWLSLLLSRLMSEPKLGNPRMTSCTYRCSDEEAKATDEACSCSATSVTPSIQALRRQRILFMVLAGQPHLVTRLFDPPGSCPITICLYSVRPFPLGLLILRPYMYQGTTQPLHPSLFIRS